MNTLTTDRKYTVMLSAYQSINSELTNLMETEKLAWIIEHDVHAHAIRAVGVFHGGAEQSFIVHTNSRQVVSMLKLIAIDNLHQECILVSNNRKHDIQLHNSDATTSHIGHAFKRSDKAPKGATSYTILNGCDYWSVK